MRRRQAVAIALYVLTSAPTGGIQAKEPCPGDCNEDTAVTVNEIIAGVSIALGASAISTCRAFDVNQDGGITVEEIIVAVSTALTGCETPSSPTPTPVATPTPDNTLFDGTIADLAPHNSGDQLLFRVTRSDGRTFNQVRRVVDTKPNGEFVVETYEFDRHILTETYRDDGLSLYELSEIDEEEDVRTVCSPSLLQFQLPLVRDNATDDRTRCDLRTVRGSRFLGQILQRTRVVPVSIIPSVELPAGTYSNVIHVRAENTIASDVEQVEIYLVPGIGIVRTEESSFGIITRVVELLDGTVGGSSVRRP